MSRSSDVRDERRPSKLMQDLSRSVVHALGDALAAPGGTDLPGPVATRVPRARVPTAPGRLARLLPGGVPAQAQARALYERCLAYDREVPAGADADVDDAGDVLARFVAANLGALREIDATPAALASLARQMGRILQRSPVWLRAELRERQAAVEQFAIIGVLVRESAGQAVLQGPAAVANVQRAARGYLRQLLGLDADRLVLTAHGLAVADVAHAVDDAVAAA